MVHWRVVSGLPKSGFGDGGVLDSPAAFLIAAELSVPAPTWLRWCWGARRHDGAAVALYNIEGETVWS